MKTKVLVKALEIIEPYKAIVQRVQALPEEERGMAQKTIREVADQILDEFWRKRKMKEASIS